MKNKKIILSCLFFIILGLAITGESLYSPTWGYALDLPEGFVLTSNKGNSRYLFQHSIQAVDLQIALYEKKEFNKIKEVGEHIFSQLKMEHKDLFFTWRNKDALLSMVKFTHSPDKNYKAKNLAGWLLSLELPNEKGYLVLLSYTDEQNAKNFEPLMISSLDMVFVDTMSYFEPGPVTAALYPKKGEQEVNYTFNNKNIKFKLDTEDGLANQSVVDREFSLLTIYLKNKNVFEAWKRYYRAIFRDAWSRIYPASFSIQTALSNFDEKPETEKVAKELLTLVQNFNYERNHKGSDFINLPDALLEKRGDCDSRALLMLLILKQMNIDAILLISPNKSHSVLAVDCKGSGARFSHNNKNYLIAETTAHVDLGLIEADMANPDNWFAVDFYVFADFNNN